ncbi:MAG: hypothetical protein O3B86_04220 [Planctomycetota bacterium]|nr:hypothetical protein [Planctomycetota bacterium]
MAYLKLFHGRASPDEKLDGWGEEGPIFGPHPFFHTVYGSEITFDAEQAHTLPIMDGFVFYDDMFYGDWSVYDGPVNASDESRLTEFEAGRTQLPRPAFEQRNGSVCPNSLWADLVAAVNDNLMSSVSALASALVEWLEMGGDPPEISLRLKLQEWFPEPSIASGIVCSACIGLRESARQSLKRETANSAGMNLNWYQPTEHEEY